MLDAILSKLVWLAVSHDVGILVTTRFMTEDEYCQEY